MPDGPFRPPQNVFVPSRGLDKSFRTLDPFQLIVSKLPSVQGSFSFHKISFDFPMVIRHPKSIFRSPPPPFQAVQFFQASQGPVRAMKSFVLLSGTFNHSKVLFPKTKHFARSLDRSNRGILLGAGAVKTAKSAADKAPEEL